MGILISIKYCDLFITINTNEGVDSMTFSEWMLQTYGIKVEKTQMPLPTHYIAYKEYCVENDVEEDWS